eukprot:6184823-Pleurochrysis_carterae.AAC.1
MAAPTKPGVQLEHDEQTCGEILTTHLQHARCSTCVCGVETTVLHRHLVVNRRHLVVNPQKSTYAQNLTLERFRAVYFESGRTV